MEVAALAPAWDLWDATWLPTVGELCTLALSCWCWCWERGGLGHAVWGLGLCLSLVVRGGQGGPEQPEKRVSGTCPGPRAQVLSLRPLRARVSPFAKEQ